MDMNYDYDGADLENGQHRPQSRASQHTADNNNNGHANHGGGNQHQRQYQQQQQQQRPNQNNSSHQNPYAYQENQFDEPARDVDDDMW